MKYTPPKKAYLDDGTVIMIDALDLSFDTTTLSRVSITGIIMSHENARVVLDPAALIIEDELMIDVIRGIIDSREHEKIKGNK